MPAVSRPPNRLLQALPAAEFESLRPHLETVELAKGNCPDRSRRAVDACLPAAQRRRLDDGQPVGRPDGGGGDDRPRQPGRRLGGVRCRTGADRRHRRAAGHGLHARDRGSSGRRRPQQRASKACWRGMSRRCWRRPSNRPPAMRRTRSKHACRGCCCARAICATAKTLPLTQELLAQMIGVQRNAVSIVAHALQQAGIVSYSRGRSKFGDIDGLRRTSCECYAVVNGMRCERLLNAARLAKPPSARRPQPDGHRMRLFVNFFLPTIHGKIILYFGLRILHLSGAWHPETGFARKAGDCFGFSPSFTEWIFVVADRGRFRIDPPASAHRRSPPGYWCWSKSTRRSSAPTCRTAA